MSKSVKTKFATAYNRYSSDITRYIYYKTNNRDMAEEMMQDVFLRTWKYILSNKKTKVKGYKEFLYMVASNMVVDYYRRKDKFPFYLEELDLNNFPSKPMQEERADVKLKIEIVKKYISRLDTNYKKIITYSFLNDLSVKEICDLTGLSPNYVSVLKHRGLNLLRSKIQTDKLLT